MTLLIIGIGALVLGISLVGYTLHLVHESQANPGFSWGPRQYVYNMMESSAIFGIIFTGVGIVSILAGTRRRRPQ